MVIYYIRKIWGLKVPFSLSIAGRPWKEPPPHMKHSLKDILVIGFALFSMFFGAGNVIFPPYLELSCGSQWFLGFVCYYLADIGLALLALFSIFRSGNPEGIMRRIGTIPSTVLMCAIVLCIGPMLAIPRTTATTYEMSMAPLFSGFSPVLFAFLFFLVILLLCLRESAVVDIVGKLLTPVLLIGLLVLIAKGVIDPIGPIPHRVLVENVPITGIEAGYQTMNVLAATVVALACVTTIALVSSAASYFSKLSGGRLCYTWLVTAICLFSAIVANMGLDQIVSIAAPVLSIVYPPTLVLIVLSFFDRPISNDWVFRMAALGALVFSMLETINSSGLSVSFLQHRPLSSYGFGWIVPAALFGILGTLIHLHQHDSDEENSL